MRYGYAILLCGCLIASGCDTERLNKLEKENANLKAKLEQQSAAMEYDLQAKCSKDARVWFNATWLRDKDTQLLDFTNHYNKSSNRCFVLVEYHFKENPGWSWVNDMTLTDVYENSKYGHFAEEHTIDLKSGKEPTDHVIDCEVYGSKCTTIDQFNSLTNPYMNN